MTGQVCRACQARYVVTLDRWRCDCGAPLDLEFESEPLDRDALPLRPATLWRYREALPFSEHVAPASLGEGVAPVVADTLGSIPVHLALEYLSPTGSYKDRGASLLVAVAAALGATEVVDDSSGNAGIALAAYGARASLRVRVFVPEDASPEKSRLASELGAEVVRVAGGRAGASEAALREAAAGAFYASHAWNPFFLHGVKTLAYSLAETFRWRPPGAVIVPVGNGGVLLGLDLGFRELRRHGTIDRQPALIGVQAARCAPITEAFRKGENSPPPVPESPTCADGVRVGAPPRGAEVLEAVRRTTGLMAEVSEDEIESSRHRLWAKGYMVENTGAVAAALVLREGARLRQCYGDLVVALTGSGLKTA